MNRGSLLLVAFLGVVVLAAARDPIEEKQLFKDWISKHNKFYSSAELPQRFSVFRANLKKIDDLNQQYPRTKFGVNKFADLSEEEFRTFYLSSKVAVRDPSWPVAPEYPESVLRALPPSEDWRPKGAVTAVKNQGQCGSCWAFSTTGNIEGQWFLAGHNLTGLSEQNLVDCDHECMTYEGQQTCDQGCNGGLMPNAYHYAISAGGLDTEASYPYEGVDDTCRFNKANVGATISSFYMIPQDETQMAAYLVNHGPVSIAVDAGAWQFYVGGVFYLPCGTSLDHGVLIVGYGTETDILDQTMPYWTIKNSWGGDWGDEGYIYVERGVGRCGVNLFATSSIV